MFDTLLDETSISGSPPARPAGCCRCPRSSTSRTSTTRRTSAGGDPAVLLAGPLPQRHGRPDRRLRLPEGLRRSLPQRQRGRRAPRRAGHRRRVAGAAGGRSGNFRTCVASAATDGTVCVPLEPIALYHTRDLHRGRRGSHGSAASMSRSARRGRTARVRPDDRHLGERLLPVRPCCSSSRRARRGRSHRRPALARATARGRRSP